MCSGKVSPRVESTALLGSWDMFYFKGSTRYAVCHTAAPGLGQVPIDLFIFKLKATMKNETQDSVLVCIIDIYIYNTINVLIVWNNNNKALRHRPTSLI